MKTNSIRRRDNSTRDDVVTIHKRPSNWFSDAIDVHRRSSDEGSNEANCSSEKAWNHKDSKPTDIKTIVCASNPIAEVIPVGRLPALGKNCTRHLKKGLGMTAGDSVVSIPSPPSGEGIRDVV